MFNKIGYFCPICNEYFFEQNKAEECFERCKVKEFTCAICRKKMKTDPELFFIEGGSRVKIECGYGSSLDGLFIEVVICDDCVGKMNQDDLIVRSYPEV